MRALMLLSLVALAGCAVVPNVDYRALGSAGHSDRAVLYRLTDTSIAIAMAGEGPKRFDFMQAIVSCKPEGCAYDGKPIDIAAIGTPIEDRTATFGIEPHTRQFVSTSISPTYYDGSLRLKTLQVEARDHKIEAINTVGAIAAGTLRMVTDAAQAASDVDLALPVMIDLAEARASTDYQVLPGNTGWLYKLEFRDADPGSQGLLPQSRAGEVHSAILVSTCRPVRITIKSGTKVGKSSDVKITLGTIVADPQWLTTVPFPGKGVIDFHPLCGADVEAGQTVTTGVDDIANALFKQAAAVRAAAR